MGLETGVCELCVERTVHSRRSKSKACSAENEFRQGHWLVELKSWRVKHLFAIQIYNVALWERIWMHEHRIRHWGSWSSRSPGCVSKWEENIGNAMGWGVSGIRSLIDWSAESGESKVHLTWAEDPIQPHPIHCAATIESTSECTYITCLLFFADTFFFPLNNLHIVFRGFYIKPPQAMGFQWSV